MQRLLKISLLATGCIIFAGLAFAQQYDLSNRIPSYTNSRALLIAVSDYENPGWQDLPNTESDVTELQRALVQDFIFDDPLINPGRVKMVNAIRRFLARDVDRLLLYYTGHGLHRSDNVDGIIETNTYLIPSDAPTVATTPPMERFADKVINAKQIVEWAEESRANHVMVVIDACSGGYIHRTVQHKSPYGFNSKYANEPVRVFLSAGARDEEVPDSSVFREEFLRAITTAAADLDRDDRITALEAYSFLSRTVNERAGIEPKLSTTSRRARYVFHLTQD